MTDWIVAKDLQLLAMIFNLMGFYHHQSCSVCHCCCYSDANESGNRINLFAFRQIGMIMFHVQGRILGGARGTMAPPAFLQGGPRGGHGPRRGQNALFRYQNALFSTTTIPNFMLRIVQKTKIFACSATFYKCINKF